MAINEITYNLELNSKPKADNKYTLLLRITRNRKHKRVSLGLSIEKKYWKKHINNNRYYLSKSVPEYSIIQNRIKELKQEAENYFIKTKTTNINGARVNLKGFNRKDFIVFAEAKQRQYEETKSVNYARHIKSYIREFKEDFLRNKDLLFDDIDIKLISEFEVFLYRKGNSKNTIANKLKCLNILLREASKMGIFLQEKNPFFTHEIKREKSTKRTTLTSEEIKLIEKFPYPAGSPKDIARDAFMFSFYCAGIRAGDCINLKWKNIVNNRIEYKMLKNKKEQSVKLIDRAKEILSKYRTDNSMQDDFIFPYLKNNVDYSDRKFFSNQISAKNALLNKYLKLIAQDISLNKRMSFHVSRHSFANYARDKTSITKLQSLLNHSSLRETQEYLESLDITQKDEAMTEIFE